MPCGFAPIDLLFFSSPRSFALPPLLQHFLQHYVTQPLLISIAIVGAVLNLIRQCVGSQRGHSFRTCGEEGGEEDREAVNPVRQKKSSSLQQNARLIKHNQTEARCPAEHQIYWEHACSVFMNEAGSRLWPFLDRCLKLVTGLSI